MGWMADQANAFLQEDWGGGGTKRLAELMYTLWTSDAPIKITSPVEITVGGNRSYAPLTLNNYTASPVSFQINNGNNVFNLQDGTVLPPNQFGDINLGDNTNSVSTSITLGGLNIQINNEGAGPLPKDKETNPNNQRLEDKREPAISQIGEAIIVGIGADTLICGNGSGATVTVKKPAKLRGHATERTITVGSHTEHQIIIPRYRVGDLIYIGKLDSAVTKEDLTNAANKAESTYKSAETAAAQAAGALETAILTNADADTISSLREIAETAERLRDSLKQPADEARSRAEKAPEGEYIDLNVDARSWCTKIPGDEA